MPRLFLSTILLAVFLASHAFGQAPTLKAVEVSEPPVLDGDLSDACWKQAPSISDFYLTTDGSPAPESTTAWLCYDEANIYAAFYCRDSQPAGIVAQQKKRGGDVDSDDWVAFTLDCYHNYVGLVWFKVTPRGVQVEYLPDRGGTSKIEWRGDWRSAAKIVDDGYIVEMEVPFSILNYDPNQTTMGVSLNRRHARTTLQWRSPDCSPDLDPRKFYTWEGLRLPRIKTRPTMMAYTLFGAGEDDAPRRMGLDMKHSLSPTMTGVVTLNPDFRNVEQQVESIDFTYTERYLSDSRPFFQESSDYFPDSNIFYSRRIGEIDAGGKISGTMGNYSLGFLNTRDFGADNHMAMQMVHRWPARAALGIAGVRSSTSGGERISGQLFGNYRLYDRRDRRVVLETDYYLADCASGSGHGSKLNTSISGYGPPRSLEWGVARRVIDPDFEPYLGFVPEKGIKTWDFYAGTSDEPTSGRIRDWQVEMYYTLADHTDGSLYYNAVSLNADCDWVNGTGVDLWADVSHRPPYHDRTFGVGFGWNSTDLYKSGYCDISFGKLAGGSYLSYEISQGWSIGDRMSMHLGYEYSRIKQPSPEAYSARQFVGTLAYDLDDERTVSGRIVSEDGGTNFYLAYRQRVRAGMDAYVIFGDPNADKTRSTVLLKLISPL